MTEPRTYPLRPHQRKVLEDLKRAMPVRVIALTQTSAALQASGAALAEAVAMLPSTSLSRMHRTPQPGQQPVTQHLIVEPSPAALLAALEGKGATAQRLQDDFARMFGGSK